MQTMLIFSKNIKVDETNENEIEELLAHMKNIILIELMKFSPEIV